MKQDFNNVILSRNPNKKAKREMDNVARSGDYNGFQGGYGKHKTSKKDISRSQRKKEDREFTLRFSRKVTNYKRKYRYFSKR